jgi:Kelch motif
MALHRFVALRSLLGTLALVACGEETPMQPSSPADLSPASASLAATANSWSPIAAMPCCDGSGVSVGVAPTSAGQSIAYVFGGTNGQGHTGTRIRAYNAATNTWSIKGPEIAAFNGNGVGLIGGKLYLTGGYSEHDVLESASPFLWVYDPVTDQLGTKANPPYRTAEGVTGVIGDKLYVLPGRCAALGIGTGFCTQDESTRKLFRYNPATDIWVTKASAPHYHKNGAAGVINNKFYVVGGNKDVDPPTRTLDVYDPVTNSWKTLAPLPVALQGLTGTAMRGLLYVAGGTGFGGSGTRKMYVYNPANNQWIAKAAPPAFGGGVANAAAKVFVNGTSRMIVVSGPTVDGPSGSAMYTP